MAMTPCPVGPERGTAELAVRAFAWILDHAEQFRLGAATGRGKLLAVKRLAELGTIAAARRDVDPEAERLFRFAWGELDGGRAIGDVIEVEPTIAIAYLPFRRSGSHSRELERGLADPSWRVGHAGWSLLAKYVVGFMLDAIGIPPPWHQAAVLRQLHIFEPASHWPYALRVAVMAHVVMWRTAMGAHWAALATEEMAEFNGRLPEWSARLSGAGLLDPLAELIIANTCVRGAPLVEAWQPIIDAQRPDGSVPARVGADSRRFEDVYHSTLVVALAATMTTRPLDTPRAPIFAHYAE